MSKEISLEEIKKFWPDNAPDINNIPKYISKYNKEKIVIKYGGNVLIDRAIFNNFIEDIIYLDECLQVADEKHLWFCKSIMITNDILQHATENDELELYNASIFSENGVEYLEYMLDFGDQDVATTRHNRNWFYAAEIDHVTKLLHDKYKECAEHIDDIRTDLSLKLVGIDNR